LFGMVPDVKRHVDDSLDASDRAMLSGECGPAMAFAMRLVLQAARIMGATSLVPVTFAHIDACFYNGQAHIDFANYLLEHGAVFAVPSWTNNGVVSLTHTELYAGHHDQEMVQGATELMRLYEELGCKPTWTCAPYQLPDQPSQGDHIVVGESNAVTFYNSVLGARTNKYGDYLDVACALVGKAPFAGLHTDEGRMASIGFTVEQIPEQLAADGIFFHLVGHHVGRIAGRKVPVISGLPAATREDDLKAISTAVAASGGVELWHGVGLTPEAPDLAAVFRGGEMRAVTVDDLRLAQRELSLGRDGPLDLVALGTPHFSAAEFRDLIALLDGRKAKTQLIVTTSRFVMGYLAHTGWAQALAQSGVQVVGDICSYYAPGIKQAKGRAMTNSAKWAYYAPGMLPVEVFFGSLKECVESAVRGEVWRDQDLWRKP
jgi:predicted aconitase